jgi:hypothetical protein
MANRRFYRSQRARDNRNGGIGLVTFRLEQQEKAKKEKYKPYNWHKLLGRTVGRPIDKALFGGNPFKPRRRRKRK